MVVEGTEPTFVLGEREMRLAWLDYHRATLAWKCDGLTDDQLRERAVPPSTLSLLGLVRHMVEVERGWFRRTMEGEDIAPIYYSAERPDDDFDDLGSATPESVFARWREECEHARQVVDATQ